MGLVLQPIDCRALTRAAAAGLLVGWAGSWYDSIRGHGDPRAGARLLVGR